MCQKLGFLHWSDMRRVSEVGADERQTIIEEYVSGASASAVAAKHELNAMAVARLLRAAGVEIRTNRRISDEDDRRMRELADQGLSASRIASIVGTTPNTVSEHLARPSWRDGRTTRRGVTAEDREEVAKLAKTGMTITEIARRVGRTPQLVSRILGPDEARRVREERRERVRREILELHESGMSMSEIAQRTGHSPVTCSKYIHESEDAD